MPNRPLRHAVVLGGSIAGLLATRVLSDHFETVTLVERDTRPLSPEPRKGVPQGRHAHALLLGGRVIAQSLFPGLAEELCEAGAALVASGREFAWHHAGSWRVQFETDLSFLSMTRPLLETKIAERVSALPNVRVLEGVRVTDVQVAHRQVGGVRITTPANQGQVQEIGADLIVDATGRGSATPQWLSECGFDPPQTELLKAPVVYASCTFRRTESKQNWRSLIVTGAPSKRTGFIFPVEGNRWLVTLASFFDEPSPRDHGGFLEAARSMPVPDIYDVIRDCEPLSEVVQYRFGGSQRRRFERLDRFPEGLIVMGDAVCSFNPVYGQGMTVGAVEAERLNQALAHAKSAGGIAPDFSRRWFRTITPIVDAAWDAVLIEDYRFPELASQRPLRLGPLQWYMGRVHRATYRSPRVTEQIYQVVSFLAPPSTLFRPRIAADVLFGG